MPLTSTTDAAQLVADGQNQYLIFYASVEPQSGKMWCPDCLRVQDLVESSFDGADKPAAIIVYVGQRHEWKNRPDNQFRGQPWEVSSVPTIVRLSDGARLVDDEITSESLSAFLKA